MLAGMKSGREKTSRARVLFAMDWLDYELNLGIAQYAREETAKWGELIRSANIRLD